MGSGPGGYPTSELEIAWKGKVFRGVQLPKNTNCPQVYGVSLLAGIGFIVVLFIGTSAFRNAGHVRSVWLGVMSGCILPGLLRYALLTVATRQSTFHDKAAASVT